VESNRARSSGGFIGGSANIQMSKSQIPSSKSQGNLKDQIPKPTSSAMLCNLGHWDLEFVWNLGFGYWDLIS
jgi:hypothetical protein